MHFMCSSRCSQSGGHKCNCKNKMRPVDGQKMFAQFSSLLLYFCYLLRDDASGCGQNICKLPCCRISSSVDLDDLSDWSAIDPPWVSQCPSVVCNLVDPASSHMLVSKIKPCMSQYKFLYCKTANGSLKQS